ncbi:MAG TPA: ZIP family metal transporter [Candidatus Paceibacterota bacterium]|nr:ZIP family metal transporter [Candidatus Paceibacterota bacterium]
MTLIYVAIGALVATLLGGLFAIRWSDKLHLILGFSAGALIGVALFDLLPEAMAAADGFFSADTVMLSVALGFACYMILDRLFFMHGHDDHCDHSRRDLSHEGEVGARGSFGAGSLSFHSFLDGVAIGLGFHVSTAVGAVVAAAVLTHDFSDGINTVSMILRHGGDRKQALRWLMIDALAPVAGIASTFLVAIPAAATGIVLSVFCGFFLYIGASDLLPESHHAHPTRWTTFATILGMAVIYLAVRFAS